MKSNKPCRLVRLKHHIPSIKALSFQKKPHIDVCCSVVLINTDLTSSLNRVQSRKILIYAINNIIMTIRHFLVAQNMQENSKQLYGRSTIDFCTIICSKSAPKGVLFYLGIYILAKN